MLEWDSLQILVHTHLSQTQTETKLTKIIKIHFAVRREGYTNVTQINRQGVSFISIYLNRVFTGTGYEPLPTLTQFALKKWGFKKSGYYCNSKKYIYTTKGNTMLLSSSLCPQPSSICKSRNALTSGRVYFYKRYPERSLLNTEEFY